MPIYFLKHKPREDVLKKILTTISISAFLAIFSQMCFGQESLPFVENFGYSTGDLVTVSGGVWTEATSSTSVPVQVITGNLNYTNYPYSGLGSEIEILGGASRERIRVAVTEQSNTGDAVYASFLLKLTDDNNLDGEGAYFASLSSSTSSSAYRSKVFIRPGSVSGKYQIWL